MTSLHLFDESDEKFVTPTHVMIDSGARVFILISSPIAKALGLTIEPGTAPLKGIGGAGGSLGKTKEFITI